jgi:hypothetical protein
MSQNRCSSFGKIWWCRWFNIFIFISKTSSFAWNYCPRYPAFPKLGLLDHVTHNISYTLSLQLTTVLRFQMFSLFTSVFNKSQFYQFLFYTYKLPKYLKYVSFPCVLILHRYQNIYLFFFLFKIIYCLLTNPISIGLPRYLFKIFLLHICIKRFFASLLPYRYFH